MATSSGGGGVPPGFRFHPTDEELLHYYLKKKLSFQKIDMEVIREVDLNKIEPWDLQERCRIGSAPQNEWYFFSHKDRKYPTGSRTNRATSAGFWKATGRDKCIRNSFKKIGMRKTLVFYRGRAPHGQKTDWIMHEYRLEDSDDHHDPHSNPTEDGWVICRVFKKKNLFKVGNDGAGGSMNSDHQLNNVSSTAINQQPARSFMQRDNLYLPRQQYTQTSFDLYKSELALNYSHTSSIPLSSYPHIQAQNHLIPDTHKPIMNNIGGTYHDYSTLSTSESPIMVKQLMSISNHPGDGGESGSESLPYQACEPGRDQESMSEWDMLDRFVPSHHHHHHHHHLGHEDDSSTKGVRFEDANASSSMNVQINPLSLRGEMDFWGYGK